jgi:Alginate export
VGLAALLSAPPVGDAQPLVIAAPVHGTAPAHRTAPVAPVHRTAPLGPSAPLAPIAPDAPVLTVTLSDVTRVESWSFFEPRPGGGDPTYTLLGNRAALGVAMRSRHFDLFGAFQYAQLIGLPRQATGPGPLGPGATYFDAARASRAYQLYIRAMSLRVKGAGLSIEAGRMDFLSAEEGKSRSAAVAAVTHERLAGRLIGGADWTPFERAFDGARLNIDRDRWRATSALVWPTQGAFEESANPTITALRVAGGSIAIGWPERLGDGGKSTASELQLFAYHYRDRRSVRSRPDNTGLSAPVADVSVATIGGSHVAIVPLGATRVDTTAWAAWQTGDWYASDHRALSVLAAAGVRLPITWHPRASGGWMHASGDRDPRDLRHGTFFPMLPTTTPSVLGGTFAQMNLRQAFADVQITPSARVALSASLHRMSLARSEDRWYSGTGATAIRGTYFGFSGRASFFATSLGVLVFGAAETSVTERWRLRTELGFMRGGDVIRRQFSGNRLFVFAVESRFLVG